MYLVEARWLFILSSESAVLQDLVVRPSESKISNELHHVPPRAGFFIAAESFKQLLSCFASTQNDLVLERWVLLRQRSATNDANSLSAPGVEANHLARTFKTALEVEMVACLGLERLSPPQS